MDRDQKASFADLIELMARLRDKDGCPWDRDQTPESLTPYIIEEAYELVEAIQERDPLHIKEELGDLLFQIVFQARIADECGLFDLSDVIHAIHSKMTFRHPHVFGELRLDNSDEVRKNWVRLKEQEGKQPTKSALGRVPRSLPSLLRGRRITENAAEVGFDWSRTEEVMDKVEEEWGEFKESVESGDPARIEDELGDLLFAIVNLSRFVRVDPERALNHAIEKFTRRFYLVETMVRGRGLDMEQMTIDELEELWLESKKTEK